MNYKIAFAMIFIASLGIGMVKGVTLEEGETFVCMNTTYKAPTCTNITESTCSDFIEDAVLNRTGELEEKCLALENISRQINSTFGRIDTSVLSELRKYENQSKKWKEAYEICDAELHKPEFQDCKNTIEEQNQSIERLEGKYSSCNSERGTLKTDLDNCSSGYWTGPIIAAIIGFGAAWVIWGKKKEVSVEGQPGSYERQEGFG